MAESNGYPERVIENLRRFNRKERYYLIGAALDNPEFKIGYSFRKRLQRCLGLRVPEDAFVAMDYHLNWVYASLVLAYEEEDLGEVIKVRKPFPNPEEIIKGNQQDIDLLIAYPKDNKCHLLFLEAKGDSGFTNEQFNSKVERLGKIFGADGCCRKDVKPYFAIISRRYPSGLNRECWPAWIRGGENIPWLKLPWPEDLVRVSRCKDSGEPSARGCHWTVLK